MSEKYPKTGQSVEFLYTFGPARAFRTLEVFYFQQTKKSGLGGFQPPIAATSRSCNPDGSKSRSFLAGRQQGSGQLFVEREQVLDALAVALKWLRAVA